MSKVSCSNFYYVSIPKTGSTSCRTMLFESSRRNGDTIVFHSFAVDYSYRLTNINNGHKRYRNHLSPVMPHYVINRTSKKFVFTSIRNPFDLLCSYYFYGDSLKPNRQYCHSGWASVNYSHQFKSFEDFIFAYCDNDFNWHYPLLKQNLFSQMFNKNGECVIDACLKLENLQEAFYEIYREGFPHKITVPSKSVNKSKRKEYSDYRKHYTDNMIDLVYNKCEYELKTFHYDFYGSTSDDVVIWSKDFKFNLVDDSSYYIKNPPNQTWQDFIQKK